MSEKDYLKFEDAFVRYRDLLEISNCNKETDKEPFVEFSETCTVRKTVCEKLRKADEYIKQQNPNLKLVVAEGWRSMEKQTKNFEVQLQRLAPLFDNEIDLYEAAHTCAAVPSVAPHPTGGAVDAMIFDTTTNKRLDFGAEPFEYVTKLQYTFTPQIKKSSQAYKNRILLRTALLNQGFAPFDGEWWHFSYGDKEWAVYYGKDEYFYSQKQSPDR